MRRLAVFVVAIAAASALAASAVRAADECAGLQVCLPAPGPWVAIFLGPEGRPGAVDYLLGCPRRGYIVAGTDVRLSARQIDVGFRGETGSPVGPGTTTLDRVVFSAVNAGNPRTSVFFRPFVGCVPTTGGGARNQTGVSAANEGLKPTRPVARVALDRRLRAGVTQVAARCPGGTRILGATHAIGFRVEEPPSPSVLRGIRVIGTGISNGLSVRTTIGVAAARSAAEVQVLLLCVRTGP